MATSSFFYTGASAPDQNTVAELIADLEAKVAAAQEARNAAVLAAASAQAAADNAGASESTTQSLLIQAQQSLAAAQAAQAAAEAALSAAQAAITTTNNNVTASNAAKVAAEAAQALAETAEANAELAESNAETAQAAAQASATAASGSATSAATSASTATTQAGIATTQAGNAATSATNAANSASAASTSATNAANSASAASTSATNAAASATTATTKASEASASATAAASSASAASTSASNASTSASNAASSATAASGSASAASSSATSASNSASTATTQASNAAASASAALASQNAAATSATNAASSATAASNSATSATNSANAASAAQTAAETARDQTLASFDSFDDRYLGTKTSDPTLDNDGNALIAGTLYFNSSLGIMKVYTGSLWVDAYAAGSSFLAKANNLSDLPSVSTARTNLGLGSAATTSSSDYATAAQGTKADTAFGWGNHASAGYVTRTISVNDTTDGLRITQTGTGNALVVEDSANPDSTPFIIDNAGNVGVGTSTMVAKMNVAQSFDSVLIQATNGTVGHRVSYILSGVAYTGTSNAYPLSLMTVGTEAIRIDTSQRVGIGKNNPATRLDVNGTVTATAYAGGNTSNWDTAFGWGNHASAGYATTSYVNSRDTAVEGNALAFAIALG